MKAADLFVDLARPVRRLGGALPCGRLALYGRVQDSNVDQIAVELSVLETGRIDCSREFTERAENPREAIDYNPAALVRLTVKRSRLR